MSKVYVIGAGASAAAAGLPLGKELVWDYHGTSLFKTIGRAGPDMSGDTEAFARFEEFISMAEDFLPELAGELRKWQDRGIWRYAFRREEKKYYVDEILQLAGVASNAEAIDLIRLLIFEHIAQATLRTQNPQALYTDFLQALRRNEAPSKVTLISFNFDCLLAEDLQHGTSVDYRMDFDFAEHRPGYCASDRFILLKPNGSIDWGVCRSCERLHLLSLTLRRGDYPRGLCCAECDGPLYPYMVVPHEAYRGRITALWDLASETLVNASELVIVGYSFPDYDQRVRTLLRSSISQECRVTVIDYRDDPSADTEKQLILNRLHAVFPYLEKAPTVSLNGFREHVHDLDRGRPH